jgi:putative methyltransferase (TIGR04325 family)
MSLTDASFLRFNVSTLPGYRQLRQSGMLDFIAGKEFGHYRGRFKTSVEARNSLPVSRRATYDSEALVSIGIESYSTIHLFDWPVLGFLQKMMSHNQLTVMTDFGGHVGVKFYAFREMLDFPKDFQWQVVEVPAMVREGRRRVPPGVNSLSFFERLEETAPCDALLCSGSLQYVDWTIEEIVDRLPRRPAMVFVNKVPVSKERGFFTIETFVKSLPCHIFGPNELEKARRNLGYKLAANWPIPHRDFVVLSSKGMEKVQMVGEAWTLESGQPQ